MAPDKAEKGERVLEPRPEVVVGRTLYDASAELFQLLGRALPYITIIAIVFYALIEVSKSYQQARSDAIQEYATRVEALTKLQEAAFAGVESLRLSQLQTIEKLSSFNTIILDSIAKNQEALSKAREEIEREQTKQQEVEAKLRLAEQKQADSDRKRSEQDSEFKLAEDKLLAAENTIDIANRLTTFVTTSGLNAPAEIRREYLSRLFESATPDAVRRDGKGTLHYGIYRIPGPDVERFLTYIRTIFPEFYSRLNDVGGVVAAQKGASSFRYEWISLSRDEKFRRAQETYVEEIYYDPLVEKVNGVLRGRLGQSQDYDITSRSTAIKAVLWSIAVQHGLLPKMVIRGLDGVDLITAKPDEIIKAIYAERRQTDRYFPNENDETRRVLAARYVFEEQVALRMSAKESPVTNTGDAK